MPHRRRLEGNMSAIGQKNFAACLAIPIAFVCRNLFNIARPTSHLLVTNVVIYFFQETPSAVIYLLVSFVRICYLSCFDCWYSTLDARLLVHHTVFHHVGPARFNREAFENRRRCIPARLWFNRSLSGRTHEIQNPSIVHYHSSLLQLSHSRRPHLSYHFLR